MSRQIPRLVAKRISSANLDSWAAFYFSDQPAKATLSLIRFGVERKICARPYAPLLSATGTVLVAGLRIGDFVYLDGDTKVSWQITSIEVDW